MQHGDFHIGDRFWTNAGEFLCTDVGTRTIAAVAIGAKEIADPSWLNGPPYAVAELVFDEYDLDGCYPTAAARDEDLSDPIERIVAGDLDDPEGNLH